MSNAADTAIAFARAQIGKPYQWGATGPNAYDCSGLVQASYKSAGIQLARTTYGQVTDGPKVAQSDLAPGDLVFPDAGHVQIYTGNGSVVEAPSTGLKVREVPMWGYWTAVRVTTPGTSSGKTLDTSGWTELTPTERTAVATAALTGQSTLPAGGLTAVLSKLTPAHKKAYLAVRDANLGGSSVHKTPLDVLKNAPGAALGTVTGWTETLGKILSWLGDSKHWIRIGEVFAGVLLIVIALSKITNIALPSFASKAAGMAAFA